MAHRRDQAFVLGEESLESEQRTGELLLSEEEEEEAPPRNVFAAAPPDTGPSESPGASRGRPALALLAGTLLAALLVGLGVVLVSGGGSGEDRRAPAPPPRSASVLATPSPVAEPAGKPDLPSGTARPPRRGGRADSKPRRSKHRRAQGGSGVSGAEQGSLPPPPLEVETPAPAPASEPVSQPTAEPPGAPSQPASGAGPGRRPEFSFER